ncbi:MAG: 3-oxoacyl-ACP reductase FabG [Clostridia bacterium]|nr:3-oxoacyl-ACP reductase FabG [Clostridia bacterium]
MKKTALITGASGGIGGAAAVALAAEGFRVAMCYNSNEKAVRTLASKLNKVTDTVICKADVSVREQAEKAFENAAEEFGGVSVLVNCAGISQQKLFTDITDEDFDRMMAVNVKGVFNCCQAALPFMIKNKRGKIINVSSMWGVCGASCEVHYSASKAAVIGLTKALARELAPSNIQVNCIAPGVIDTKMNACFSADELRALKEEIPLGRFGKPEEVAALIAFLASEKSDYITAQVIGIDGAFI